MKCPGCEADGCVTKLVTETIRWGRPYIEIVVTKVPVHSCAVCDLEWVDHVGSQMRDDAVQAYVKKLKDGTTKG